MADSLAQALASQRGPLAAPQIKRSEYLAKAIEQLQKASQSIQSYPELGTRLLADGVLEYGRRRAEKKAEEGDIKDNQALGDLFAQILSPQAPQQAPEAPAMPPVVNPIAPAQQPPQAPPGPPMQPPAPQPQAAPMGAAQPPAPQPPPPPVDDRIGKIKALLSHPDPRARALGMQLAQQMLNPDQTVVNTARGPMRVNSQGPEGMIGPEIEQEPIYMNTADGIIAIPRGGAGGGEPGKPSLVYSNISKNTAGKPTIAELRQLNNTYEDDVRAITQNMGNLRNSVGYASSVIASRGAPPPGENARLSDVRLLRAAARADTGPGVLTESEVFGTLSPSLQQDIRKQGAYFDATRVNLTPQDRLALAQNVLNGARSTSNDLWRRYEGMSSVLEGAGVGLNDAGITAPEFPHPDDMAALNSPRGQYEVGGTYRGPSGRVYQYNGPGRWQFVRKDAPSARAGGVAPKNAEDNGLAAVEAALRARGIDPDKLP